MTTDFLTDTTTDEGDRPTPVPFDAERDDTEPEDNGLNLDGADLTLWEFCETISRFPKGKELKRSILLAIVVETKGKAGETIDWDAIAEHIDRKVGSLQSYQAELAEDGWLERVPGLSKEKRPIFVYRTLKTVRG